MNGSRRLMPIGRFAEVSRLSPKALRLYDSLGLLSPAYVDGESGYRFYGEEQLSRARMIVMLRRLDMPLAMIERVVAAPADAAREMVETYWEGVEAKLAGGRAPMTYLTAYLQGREQPMSYEVQVKVVPDLRVATVSREVYINGLEDFITKSMERLSRHIEGAGARVAGAPMAIYHGEVNADSNGPVEIAVPVSGEVPAREDIEVKTLPGGRVAFAIVPHRKVEFPEILEAYDAVHDWIKTNGYEVGGSPREIYLEDPKRLSPDDPFVEIAWPVKAPLDPPSRRGRIVITAPAGKVANAGSAAKRLSLIHVLYIGEG